MRLFYLVYCIALFICCIGFPVLLTNCDNTSTTPAADATDTTITEGRRRMEMLNDKGDSLFAVSAYDAAIITYREIMDLAAQEADSFPYYDAMLDLATIYDRIKDHDKAIELAQVVTAAYERSGDTTRIGRGYSTLGGFFGRAGRKKESLETTKKGFDILKFSPSLPHRCAAYNQMAFTYSDGGDWEKACPMLDTALSLYRQTGETHLLPGLLLNTGDAYRNLKRWPEAERLLQEALLVSDTLGQLHVHARVLERLSQVAEANGRDKTALDYYKQAKTIRDSLFTAEKTKNIQELEMKFQTKEKESTIQTLQAEKKARDLQQYLMVLAAMFALALAGYLYFFRQSKMQSALQALTENRRNLQELAQILLEKNTRIGELEALSQQPSTQREEELPDDLFNIRILTENDWTIFKSLFDKSHPHFLFQVRQKFPDITSAEERMLALIKMNFNRNELASTLGISSESVKKGRHRLRKRMGLAPDEDLEAYIHSL